MKPKRIMVIGSCNTDMTIFTEHIPLPGETVLGNKFNMGSGGKGANQAIAIKRLGGDVLFACKVGNDILGDNLIRHYEAEGIDIAYVSRCDTSSGVALITVDAAGENNIVVASGANATFAETDIEILSGEIRDSSILLLQLEIPLPAVLKAARIAFESGVYVVLNPAPAVKLPDEIYKYISLIVPNFTETFHLTSISPYDAHSIQSAVDVLLSKGVKNIILTMGDRGCVVADRELSASHIIPAVPAEVIDTTAAGDTFCGALCVALSEGKTLYEAAEFANAAAALSVQRYGAQESIPYRKDLDKISI